MSDGPIVVKVSIRRGDKKPFSAQYTITEDFLEKMGEPKTKEFAMAYLSGVWEKARKLKKQLPKLRLIKE